ncbi:MerR family transcriptional regulator [Saccharothrix luteola]|uniref:MerR family transcriptional regulator n=1 Tax=Saccharothrix luteola TaxID=2893018 RepID=UPI001E46DD53|nr:MerR family transcriptional regulator [Saccharothrix luteola]MCC8247025.1 MerR family transcriptional regulator [Saccharothrix luteola]
MWRIGQLARMVGVSDRTLRHYDEIGLLRPAAVDRATGYRWYGVAELTRLERVRGLRRLGLPLRQIVDLVDAPDTHLRQALTERVDALRRDIAALSEAVAAAEDRLAVQTAILPQRTTVAARRVRVERVEVGHPSELGAWCSTTVLTWLDRDPTNLAPVTGFAAAVATERGGEPLVLPERTVVRAVAPPTSGVVRAGRELFDWLRRHHLAVDGPTVEEHLVDGDGDTATVLEIPVRPAPARRSR